MACKKKYRPGKRFLCGSVVSCCLSVLVGLIACGGFFVFRNLVGVDPNNALYLPGDTKLVEYSSVICQGLTLSANKGGSLYLDPATPRLTNRNTLDHVNMSRFKPHNYWRWPYLLHPGSNITISACSLDYTDDLYIFIIQGQDEIDSFDSAIPSGYWQSCCSVRSKQITDECSDGSNTIVAYTTKATDTYSMLIYNSGDDVQFANFSFYIERTEYSPSDVSESCTSNSIYDPCTLAVPFHSNYTGLLVKNMSEEASGEYIFTANIYCKPRTATLVVVILAAFVIAVLVFGVISCVCAHVCCPKQCCSRKGGSIYTPLLNPGKPPTQVYNYPRPDPVNNYPQPDPVPNYPRPDPVPVNNYPRPDPVPVNNYPRPDPVPVNNYPRPDPIPVNNYPRPDPVPVNNYPRPDPNPINNYPRPDPVPVNNYPRPDPVPVNNQHAYGPQFMINNYPPRARGPNQIYPGMHAAI